MLFLFDQPAWRFVGKDKISLNHIYPDGGLIDSVNADTFFFENFLPELSYPLLRKFVAFNRKQLVIQHEAFNISPEAFGFLLRNQPSSSEICNYLPPVSAATPT
jgi:hypothetical protein